MTVLQTSSDLSQFDSVSGAELYNSSLLGHKQVTVCARFFNHQFTSQTYLNILVYRQTLQLLTSKKIAINDIRGVTRVDRPILFKVWDIRMWNHACILLDASSGTVKTVINGRTVANTNFSFDHSLLAGNLTMMAYPKGEGFSHSFFGRLTDVNIWSRSLTEEEVAAWTLCHDSGGGDLVDWRTATWGARGLKEVQVEREEVCRERTDSGLKVSDNKRNFDDSLHFASLLGGEIAVASSNTTMQKMINLLANQSEACGKRFFTGYSDRQEEGRIVNINTGEEITWNVWIPGEPNNWGGNEDCTDNRGSNLNDVVCDKEYCPILNMTKSPKFRLRGLCQESIDIVDVFYTLIIGKETLFEKQLLGLKQTTIIWSSEFKQWNLMNLADRTILAYSNSTHHYPFGKQRWFFINSSCTDHGQSWRHMNLQQKVEYPGHFCCDDGLCIDSKHRCDGNKHCQDYSDERSCELVNIPSTYNSKIPPSSMQKKGREIEFLPIEVKTYVEIKNIISMDEEASQISLKFYISYEWIDYQLNYRFLKAHTAKNIIEENNPIWIPHVGFSTPSHHQTKSIEVDRTVLVERQGKVMMDSGDDFLYPNETYSGNENPLTLRIMYQGDFFCDFAKISSYPFDTEECNVELYLRGSSEDMVKLIPKVIIDNGPASIGQYDVKEWRLTKRDTNLKITVYLGRNIASIFMVTYLPTILMNLVNQATNYSRHNYELVITVNITCMMVLASVYISVSNSLPVTAAIKHIEIWLLFNLAYPVMVIVVNIILQVN